jgi:hypothetical protein
MLTSLKRLNAISWMSLMILLTQRMISKTVSKRVFFTF